MPKPASTRPAYKMLTCIYLCRTLLFFAPYADFSLKNDEIYDLKAIPTLYLLNKEKKVLLKDATFQQIENYLSQTTN